MSKIIGKILIILGFIEFALAIFYQPLIHKYSSSLLCILGFFIYSTNESLYKIC